jgi:hypothetical protein
VGCSGPATPTGVKAPVDQAAATFGGPPLVTPGERMTYRLSLKGIELAVFAFGVGDVGEVDGKQTVIVQSRATTSGLAAMVSQVDDQFSSWIDVQTGRSVRFQVDELNPKEEVTEHTIVDFTKRAANTFPVSVQVGDAEPKIDPQTASQTDIWDFNSFLVALRAWEPANGASVSIESMRSRFMWHIDAKLVGSKKVVTELGELPALEFLCTSYRLLRSGTKDTNNPDREFTIFVSDDAGRVPLLVTAVTDYGDVKLEIVDYQPGTGQRLRP